MDRIKDFQGVGNNRQPMVEVEVVPAMVNHLNPTSKPIVSASKFPAKCESSVALAVYDSAQDLGRPHPRALPQAHDTC